MLWKQIDYDRINSKYCFYKTKRMISQKINKKKWKQRDEKEFSEISSSRLAGYCIIEEKPKVNKRKNKIEKRKTS